MQFISHTIYKNEFKMNSIPKYDIKLLAFRKLLEGNIGETITLG